jgi:DHA2 family multidrug resistance protein
MPAKHVLAIIVAVLASLLEMIDSSIVYVTVPTMMGNLGATLNEVTWVMTGYVAAAGVALPMAAWLSDKLGRNLYLTSCIAIFTISSAVCGFAPNLKILVAARIVQGFAGGALLPTSQALLYELFPTESSAWVGVLYGGCILTGPVLGPVLGGWLTDSFGWRAIFYVNIPIGIAVCLLSHAVVPDSRVRSVFREIDVVGLVLLVVGFGCLQYVLQQGHADDWFSSRTIIACSIVSAICICALVPWELKHRAPIINLRLFKNRSFAAGTALMTMLGGFPYGIVIFVPIFASAVHGLSELETGKLFIPSTLMGTLGVMLGGALWRKLDPRWLILIGVVGVETGMIMMGAFNSQTSVAGMYPGLTVRGFFMNMLFIPISTAVTLLFDGSARRQAVGILNLGQQLGFAVFAAVFSTLFDTYSHQAYGAMADKVGWFDLGARLEYGAALNGAQYKFPSLLGIGAPAQDALRLIVLRAEREALVLSFQRICFLCVALYALTLIPIFFLRREEAASARREEPSVTPSEERLIA